MLVMCGGGTTPQVDKGMPVRCAGCGGGISDRYYLLAVDRQWHASCLTCCQCKVQLDTELTCFSRDGRIYCKEDYYRMFSVKRCNRCHLSISPNELVMRAREHVYHLHCFTCATCNKPLTKGDYFGLREDVIYCRAHYEMLLQYERPYVCAQQCLKEENSTGDVHPLCDKRGRCQNFEHLVPAHLQLPCGAELLPEFQPPRANGREEPLRTAVVKAPGQKGRPRKQKGFLSSSLLIPHRGERHSVWQYLFSSVRFLYMCVGE
ncbi:hypothetical protein CEXT_613831 [Caerostris extrusa]|uniref:LIM zinc-binding domain-containing protein n=1 Tax=Caerostris extrusa TaxID=172846 RepID=A0AAV4NDD6_CAEEX|nr:hypothetical protein CEXT_613831 [Caerostris extrusa]